MRAGIASIRSGKLMTVMVHPRMHVVWTVLEAAKDCGDEIVIATCRRLSEANRLGWEKYRNPADYHLVREFYEARRALRRRPCR
jgi:hypothetical protein